MEITAFKPLLNGTMETTTTWNYNGNVVLLFI